MSLSIATNISSMIAQENLRVNNNFQSQTIQRLTSGYRINSSGDDAAGLAVANKFRTDIAELNQGVRNANDGISALQIIDGGLNNISKILDRLKTLATQSASTTFTGSRATLDKEFQSLLGEIDRQAASIGLSAGGRYNSAVDVYIGGGDVQTNSKVSVDLSGAVNQVDTAGLGISGMTVAGGGSDMGAVQADGAGTDADFVLEIGGNTINLTVKAKATGQNMVDDLNTQLNQYGLSASLNSGHLLVGGASPFLVTASDTGLLAAATGVTNASVYNYNETGAYVHQDETLTFTTSLGQTTVALLVTDTADTAAAKINAAAKSLGVYAFNNGGKLSLQSSGNFTVGTDTASATDGVIQDASGVATIATPDATKALAYNALATIGNIENAVARLGMVQGKVGTGQNQLSYAINLAQSQITSFSAAESRIRDADVASEAANLTKAQVLQQASLAAMAQANSAPQAVLALLRG